MEITSHKIGQVMEVRVAGRLDAHWSDHLVTALDELVRQGHDRVHLSLDRVDYISSLGIRALLTTYRKFQAVQGHLSVGATHENVLAVLRIAGLTRLLVDEAPRQVDPPTGPQSTLHSFANGRFDVFELGGSGMVWHSLGDPGWAEGHAYSALECRRVGVGTHRVSLGLGAFGTAFETSRDRFGEFLSVAGAATYQPGDGSNNCDTLLGADGYQAELLALHGLGCEGNFTHLVRFETQEEEDTLTLSTIAEFALGLTGGRPACLVIGAEIGGLIGASLKRSPALVMPGEDPFGFPLIRDWLSFTTERAYGRMSAVACGVVAGPGAAPASLVPQLRPLAREEGVVGHLHAAVFRFHPLPRGLVDLNATLHPWFEHDTVTAVLHLLSVEDAPEEGVEESRFTRGACWVSALTEATEDTA